MRAVRVRRCIRYEFTSAAPVVTAGQPARAPHAARLQAWPRAPRGSPSGVERSARGGRRRGAPRRRLPRQRASGGAFTASRGSAGVAISGSRASRCGFVSCISGPGVEQLIARRMQFPGLGRLACSVYIVITKRLRAGNKDADAGPFRTCPRGLLRACSSSSVGRPSTVRPPRPFRSCRNSARRRPFPWPRASPSCRRL